MKKRIRCITKLFITIALCCAWLNMPILANAENTPSEAPEPQAEGKFKLPTVVVTAEKRATNIQRTPMAITVFTAQDLEDNNIKTIQEALSRVLNLTQVEDIGGNTKINFRGALASTATETSPLVMYIDGVPVDSYAYLDANLLNVERIEVLRGAQSAIYGKNAFAGVINIISKQPDNTFQGKVFVDGGTELSGDVGGIASGPIIEDKLMYSFSTRYDYREGYMDHPNSSDSNKDRNLRLKGQLRLLPTTNSEVNFHIDYTANRKGFIPYALGDTSSMTSPAADSDYRDEDVANMALHGKVDFSDMTFKSITTFRKDDMKSALDTKPIYGPIFGGESNYHDVSKEVTQEFRLQNSQETEDGIDWLIGLYGGYRDFDRKEFNLVRNSVENTDYPYNEETQEFAPFAQVVVPLIDGLSVTAGFRWQYTKRNASLTSEMFKQAVLDTTASKTWTEWLPRLIVSYDITDEHMIYAGVNKSFLPGGFNRQNFPTVTNYVYEPQTAWNYEIGSKNSWFDKRLTANLTLFYSQYKDTQVRQWDAALVTTFAENAGESTAYGAELEMDMLIIPDLRASLALGYTHAEYDEYVSKTATGDIDYSGKRVELTPRLTGNASLIYRHQTGIMAQIDAQYASKMYWSADNDASRDSIITTNAQIGYETDSFDIYLYSTNLFDKRYTTAFQPGGGYGSDFVIVAPPREVGLKLVYRW